MIINPSVKIRHPLEKLLRLTMDIFSTSTLMLYGVYYKLFFFIILLLAKSLRGCHQNPHARHTFAVMQRKLLVAMCKDKSDIPSQLIIKSIVVTFKFSLTISLNVNLMSTEIKRCDTERQNCSKNYPRLFYCFPIFVCSRQQNLD